MTNSRRNWLKKAGILIAGAGLIPSAVMASPAEAIAEGPEGDSTILLCFNENPYGPSPRTRKAMAAAISSSNRYPWQMIRDLMSAIAAKHGMSSANVLVGAGSTQVLDTIVQYAAQERGNFIVADPTFDRWAGEAEAMGLQKIVVPLTKDKRYDLPAMASKINEGTRLVHICNPNNPTGTVCNRDELVAFIREATRSALVLVDEAYLDYSSETSLSSLVKENERLLVVKTFSKIYGMAGARVGYALGHEKTIDKIGNLQAGANMGISTASLAGAMEALNDTDFVKSSFQQNEAARKFTTEQLSKLGLNVIPSRTNFLYFSLEGYKKDFFQQLKDHNIQGTGILEDSGKWTRITIGTMDEMQQFIRAVSY